MINCRFQTWLYFSLPVNGGPEIAGPLHRVQQPDLRTRGEVQAWGRTLQVQFKLEGGPYRYRSSLREGPTAYRFISSSKEDPTGRIQARGRTLQIQFKLEGGPYRYSSSSREDHTGSLDFLVYFLFFNDTIGPTIFGFLYLYLHLILIYLDLNMGTTIYRW